MRIAIATFHRNLIGGTEKYLQVMLPALIEQNHDVALLHEWPLDPERERIDRPGALPDAWCLQELGLPAILRLLSDWEPDIVFDQGLQDASLETALLDAFPTVLFAHNYYGTCGSGQKCHSFPRVQPCQRRFGPACLALHYPRHCGALDPREAWRTFRLQSHRHSCLPKFRSILVASTHMRDEFLRNGISPDKVHLVPLPAEDTASDWNRPEPRPAPSRILMISRLTPLKGGHYLVPAVARASRVLKRPLQLTIAGDGPDQSKLQRLATTCDVAVEFTGWVARERKQQLLRDTDLLAVPSLWPEPFGLVGLEAGQVGVPAVGYRVGGVPDWLLGGQTGEIAPGDPPSIEGLADAIVRALSDERHYQALCDGAWRYWRKFSVAAHLDQLQPLLARAQAESQKPSWRAVETTSQGS